MSTNFGGSGNISAAPCFANAENGVFNLTLQSPCIDAGCPDSTKDADSTIADMGAIYYHQSVSGFLLKSPARDTTVTTFLPTLEWENATTGGGEPLTYDVYFSQDSASLESSLLAGDLTDNFYQLTDSLQEFVTYYWKVQAKNSWTLIKWSDLVGYFSVNTDTLPPSFSEQMPTISLDEDDSLTMPLNWWYQYVSDNRCPDSSLVFQFSSGRFVSATIQNSNCLFKSDSLNWFGQDTLVLTVKDKSNLTASANVFAFVNPINDTPTISGLPDSIVFGSDSSVCINLWDFCEDAETPDSLLDFSFCAEYNFPIEEDSLQWDYNDQRGSLCISATSLKFKGKFDFMIKVADDKGAVAIDTINVRVTTATGIDQIPDNSIASYRLFQNYPNPFNLETEIGFALPQRTQVTIEIYNIRGKLIRQLKQQSTMERGVHKIIWNGRDDTGIPVSSGFYLYRIKSGPFTDLRKMLLVK